MKKTLLTFFAVAALSLTSANAAEVDSWFTGNGKTFGGWGGQAKFEQVTEDDKPCLKVTNPSAQENDWSVQIGIDVNLTNGETYQLSFDVKGDPGTGITTGIQNSTDYSGKGNFTTFDITEEWKSVSISATVTGDDADRITINLGKYVGTFYMTNVKLTNGTSTPDTPDTPDTPEGEIVAESDFSTMTAYNMWAAEGVDAKIENGALVVTNAEAAANFWDIQYMVADGFSVSKDVEYTITAKIKGFKGSLHYVLGKWGTDATVGSVNVDESADWQTITIKFKSAADITNEAHLLFQTGDFVGSYAIESVVITAPKSASLDNVEVTPVVDHWTVYNLSGVKVLDTDNKSDLDMLGTGIYIINGKKVAIRR